MSKIIIHNVQLNGQPSDVTIENKLFSDITPAAVNFVPPPDAKVIDGTNQAITAPFYNTHNHAGMTLLRGFADDMRLQEWLNEHIWPIEAKLTAKITYDGVRLAILEMIKSGTVSFNDMYFFQTQTIRAAEELGVRAQVGVTKMMKSGSGEKITPT
ncbi:MAG: amidohydrolase family protein [Victivallaceae bacterium]